MDPNDIRNSDFKYWLETFCENYSLDYSTGTGLSFEPQVVELLNSSYWILRDSVKEYMFDPDKRINCYKVIAGVQSVILYFQPISSPIETTDNPILEGIRRINAQFAWVVSMKIYVSFLELEFNNFEKVITEFSNSFEFIQLREFHLLWCEKADFIDNNDGNLHSYFLLAQFWQSINNWFLEYFKQY